ncbi:hemin ABC transporter substrate-binding protein [Nocardioides caeni]|uniref:Hemin receptor n=1 Tax=Nocardioides caeni TaxID=574700 RepID=A0A4S8NQZ2_9ACTN|nr:ABC transporter substrate-binding protein [Nocardioides caeni]THV17929.1 hemin receptor [Nocardioides caeni]
MATRPSRSPRRRGLPAAVLPVIALLLLALVSACGLNAPGAGDDHGGAGGGTPAPALADAEVLDDPRSWDGATTAVVSSAEVDPVADAPEPRLPVTVTDAQGTEVEVADVSRVLALDVYGTLSRTVFELGLGDRLVGRDISTQFDEAADLPLVTHNGHDLSAEAILALDPTLILTDTSLGPWDVILQMRDADIPVVVVDSHRGLDNITRLTREVATALGVPDEGEILAQRTEEQIATTVDSIAGVAPTDLSEQLRTVFLYVRGQSGVYYMFGEGSGSDSLIDALGLYDVAAELEWDGMKPVTDEAIIAAQPDLILMMSGGLDSVGGIDGLLDRLPALANTPAGEHQRLVDMADAQILGFGPQTAAVLNALAVAIYAPESVS